MHSVDGGFVVTFNGEIYNYRALRAELETKGYVFRTQSDTEVLLQLYAEKGESMVHDLRGMFAFGLWDSVKQMLLLARDPYGIKPLYYSDDGRTLRFASQVKALMAGRRIGSALDPAALTGFCLFGSVPEPFTIQQQVRALPAGCTLWIGESGHREPKHYFEIGRVLAEAASKNTRVMLVTVRLAHERRFATASAIIWWRMCRSAYFFLRGSIQVRMTGLAAEALGPGSVPLRTVNVAFEEFRGRDDDEAPLAAEVARRFGTNHSVRLVHEKEFEADLPRIFAAMDQPTIDGVNAWFVSKAARERRFEGSALWSRRR